MRRAISCGVPCFRVSRIACDRTAENTPRLGLCADYVNKTQGRDSQQYAGGMLVGWAGVACEVNGIVSASQREGESP